jgi:hypothetical protein
MKILYRLWHDAARMWTPFEFRYSVTVVEVYTDFTWKAFDKNWIELCTGTWNDEGHEVNHVK